MFTFTFNYVFLYSIIVWCYFFKKDFIYLYLDREEGRERGREASMCGCFPGAPYWGTWPTTQACDLIGNWTGNPLVHWPAISPLSHTNQGWCYFLKFCVCIFLTVLPRFFDLKILVFFSVKRYFKIIASTLLVSPSVTTLFEY